MYGYASKMDTIARHATGLFHLAYGIRNLTTNHPLLYWNWRRRRHAHEDHARFRPVFQSQYDKDVQAKKTSNPDIVQVRVMVTEDMDYVHPIEHPESE